MPKTPSSERALPESSIAKSADVKKGPQRSKYGAQKTILDGIRFDSKAESKRYLYLKGLVELGMITELELQPRYDLHVNGVRIGYYKADFRYQEEGQTIIEDVKGMKTPMYNWKKRHLRAEWGIEIRETK